VNIVKGKFPIDAFGGMRIPDDYWIIGTDDYTSDPRHLNYLADATFFRSDITTARRVYVDTINYIEAHLDEFGVADEGPVAVGFFKISDTEAVLVGLDNGYGAMWNDSLWVYDGQAAHSTSIHCHASADVVEENPEFFDGCDIFA
jgi:hypothetical protein